MNVIRLAAYTLLGALAGGFLFGRFFALPVEGMIAVGFASALLAAYLNARGTGKVIGTGFWIAGILIILLLAAIIIYGITVQLPKIQKINEDAQSFLNDLKNKEAAIDEQFNAETKASTDHLLPKNTQTNPQRVPKVISPIVTPQGWKVYHNNKYGFNFSYPVGWILSERGGNNTVASIVSIVSPETKRLYDDAKKQQRGYGPSPDDFSVYYNELGTTTLEEMIKKDTTINELGPIEVGGIQGKEVIWGGEGTTYVIFVSKNSHLYTISFSNTSSDRALTPVEERVLGTFRFR